MPSDYGQYYWCVKTSDGERVYLHADDACVVDGCLVLSNEKGVLAAFKQWTVVYAASILDGRPVCAEHWPSELEADA